MRVFSREGGQTGAMGWTVESERAFEIKAACGEVTEVKVYDSDTATTQVLHQVVVPRLAQIQNLLSDPRCRLHFLYQGLVEILAKHHQGELGSVAHTVAKPAGARIGLADLRSGIAVHCYQGSAESDLQIELPFLIVLHVGKTSD